MTPRWAPPVAFLSMMRLSEEGVLFLVGPAEEVVSSMVALDDPMVPSPIAEVVDEAVGSSTSSPTATSFQYAPLGSVVT